MSPQLIAHSDDLRQLRTEGYTLRFVAGYLVVDDVPYIDRDCVVHDDGVLVMALATAGVSTDKPADHTAYFVGGVPCASDGTQLDRIINNTNTSDLGGGLTAACYFSAKPIGGGYNDFHHKVTTYIGHISASARSIDETLTARRHRPVASAEGDGTPFKYLDTASSRAGIGQLAERLAFEHIGIIGLGGSGSYVLDFVSKTSVAQIHLYDADPFLTHNAFRAPGAPSIEQLNERPLKVRHLAAIYGNMHSGIVAHETAIDTSNADQLRGLTFVFVAIDDAPAKAPIIEKLLELGIPFIDLGMGVEVVESRLTGIVRTTLVTPERHGHVASSIATKSAGGPDDYRSNIQIVELNALNAVAAIMLWKKFRGIYADFDGAMQSMFSIASNHIVLSVDEVSAIDNGHREAA
jgi:ThiF family